METRAQYIILALLFIWALAAGSGYAGDLSEYEWTLLNQVNGARMNPRETAVRLGLDADTGIPGAMATLTVNDALCRSASDHARDMMAAGYYSKTSPDGRTVADRMAAEGYIPLESGEVLGILGFGNFFNPDDAVEAVFLNLMREELARDEKVMLNPEFRDMGISIQAGAIALNGRQVNAYLAVLDFGASANEIMEIAIHRMINEVRREPLNVAEWLGEGDAEDTAGMVAEWQSQSPTNGMAPLAWNDQLAECARQHSMGKAVDAEIESLADCAEASEYDAVSIEKGIGFALGSHDAVAQSPFGLSGEVVVTLLPQDSDGDGRFDIIDPDYTEVGVGVAGEVIAINDVKMVKWTATVIYGEPVEKRAYLIGNIYVDTPGDNPEAQEGDPSTDAVNDEILPVFGYGDNIPLDSDRGYNMGEGIFGVSVKLIEFGIEKTEESVLKTASGMMGGYQLEVPMNEGLFYELMIKAGEDGGYQDYGYVIAGGKSYMKDIEVGELLSPETHQTAVDNQLQSER